MGLTLAAARSGEKDCCHFMEGERVAEEILKEIRLQLLLMDRDGGKSKETFVRLPGRAKRD